LPVSSLFDRGDFLYPKAVRFHTFNHARADLAPYGFTCELWKAAPMRRPDRHNEIELNLLQRGSLTYLLGGLRVTIRQGSLGAFWAAIPHQIIGWERSPEYFVVTMPLAWFLQCQLPAKLVDRLLLGQFLSDPDSGHIDLDIQLCQRWEQDLTGKSPEPPRAALLELQARLLRLAEGLPNEPAARPAARGVLGEGGLSKAERMAGYIAKHYHEPVSVSDMARDVQLHPNYAMSLFKKTFRITLNDYITQYRIAQAQRLLATTDEKIIDVALESGFRTLSRFYDAFKRSCGCSPSRFRAEHRLSS
jgi:AraC family transcriptional regulator, melibiose operon regulatory protein